MEKYQLLKELYRDTAAAVTKDTKEWQDFLASACRNYKCRFDEQLLIYAQRPDATAVAEISTWNRFFKRWVSQGSKGIAVFGRKGSGNILKYYFDISDTREGYYGSLPVSIWQMDGRYEVAVSERLADRFGAGRSREFDLVLLGTAMKAVEDHLPDYLVQAKGCIQNSGLEGLGEKEIETIYKRISLHSICFMLLCRCGIEAGEYFEGKDFKDIRKFNTPATLNAVGVAVSDISEMVLREISQTIREVQTEERKQVRTFADNEDGRQDHAHADNRDGRQDRTFAKDNEAPYDKGRTEAEGTKETKYNTEPENSKETGRSGEHEGDHIQQTGGLPDSRPGTRDGAGDPAWQVRADAPGLSGESQEGGLSEPFDGREAGVASARGGGDGAYKAGADDEAAGHRAGSDGGAERAGSDVVDTEDEPDTQPGRGSDTERADLQLETQEIVPEGGESVVTDLPTVKEQIEQIIGAEAGKASAFAVSQEDIDSVLVKGSIFGDGKYRIYRQFQKREDKKSNAVFLKKEYGTGGRSHTWPDGARGYINYSAKGIAIEKRGTFSGPDMLLKWPQIEKRLRELIQNDRYLNPKEKEQYVDYLERIDAPKYEIDMRRKMERQRFIQEKRDLEPAEKRDTLSLRLSDFIRDLDGYEKSMLSEVGRADLADVTEGQMERLLPDPSAVQQLLTFLDIVKGKTSDAYTRSNAWRFGGELRELHPLRYLYQEGDTVYIGADQYEILTLSEETVSLRNVQYPIFNQEYSREDFEEKLRENPVNDHLKAVVVDRQKEKELDGEISGTETTEKEVLRTGVSKTEISETEKLNTENPAPDSLRLSIRFSEHPAFYDRELNDRFTDLSFALGNKLLGVLDEKQHRDRQDGSKNAGWYKKTGFEINAVVDGEEFSYEGRFDIGDGEGDLLAHIRNFYEYSLAPDCPFIPEWKREGEEFYREQMETLHWGQDVFVPFLEQHTELMPEEERLLAEILAAERDWERGSGKQEQGIEEAKRYINEFCQREYGEDAEGDYTDLSRVPLAYTATEDGLHAIEVRVDLLQYRMETCIDGVPVDETRYDSLDALIQRELAGLDFDELILVTQEQLEPFYKEEGREEAEKAEKAEAENAEAAEIKPETKVAAEYPAIENGLPYDITIEKIRFGEPKQELSEAEMLSDGLEQELSGEKPFFAKTDRELPDAEMFSNTLQKKPDDVKIPSGASHHNPLKVMLTDSTERHNYRITDDALGTGGAKEKFRNNIAAINLLHELQLEHRPATPGEQEVLANYVGWGGLSMAFDGRNAAWESEYKALKSALSEEEYQAAMESTLTAFYTPPVVIRAMYEALARLGFSRGNILEPSCGVGGFFGLLPENMKDSKLYGIEIDPISGGIAKQLYQKASIAIDGFEATKLPDGHFDVVMGNVPFGDFKVDDSRYNSHKFLIHDYFFAKALDKVRAGGVVMFLTSKGTMDKENPAVRKYIAQRAELLGAIRLPDNTFKANAGTEVTSDILILQKRGRVIDAEPDWLYLDTDENGITMNHYFANHPEMVLGEMKLESTRFGMDSACKTYPDKPLPELLQKAIGQINGQIPERDSKETEEIDRISDTEEISIEADPEVRNFSFAIVDGQIYFRENNRMSPARVSVTAQNRIKGLVEIRDCVKKLIRYQTDDFPEEMLRSGQMELGELYDEFTEKYGRINSRGNYLAFAADESYFLLCSLEVLDDEGKFKRKADMFTKRTIKPHRAVTSVETASEALAVSIGEKARVDLEFMGQLTGKTQEELIKKLRGVIFRIPASDPAVYVTADEYLSGNVRAKLTTAKAAAKENPEYQINAEALERVIPKDLPASEISVRLGTSWIPAEDIQQFMLELLTPSGYAAGRLRVRYTAINGDWFIENKASDYGNIKSESTYGTKRAGACRIIEDTLNLRDTRVFDYVYDEQGNKKAVLNHKETTAAQAKQELIKQAFQDWIWKDPERRNRLVRYYNDTFNSIRPCEYDGSHITFGGISPEITLRPHQVNAIAHILYGGNTLLAHKVGAGKTFEMVAAAQESKRLGLCQKSMFVVPNHLVAQWASEYLRLYPSANILVARKQDFETANRKKFCGRIATGSYDAVIIGHSQFEKIPISEERQRNQLLRQLHDIERGIDDVQRSNGEQFTVKQLMKTRKAIKAKLDKLNDTKRKDNVINFEELGVDRLFIDESHAFKNLYLYTKMRNVGGIAQTEAQKSSDLFMKCRYLDEVTGGRGIIFATGTPVSNSMVELYSVQRYLQYDTLARNGLQHFDSWASTFGETVTALELAPEGTNYRAKTRFAKFYNLPELMQMFKEVADIQTADMLKLPVPKVSCHNIKTVPSRIQTEMVAELAKRAEAVRAGRVDSRQDNMLKITNDGRKLALDQRLIDPLLPDDPDSKVNACVDNVYRIWEEYANTKAAQLIFSDIGTPKSDGRFNVYDDIREKLITCGIPAEQVRFIHEAATDAQKKELFAKVRSGEVRILLGSTQKMGAGTNVQDRLIAIHNLDCPWRPADLEQRQGRLERQGNRFPEVEVYRYVTEKTFDAYLFQLVEGKQKFISQIMTGKSPVRSAEDVDEAALSFAEVKMLATGDERFKEKMDLDIQVSKLRVLKQSYLSEHYDLEDRILKHYPKSAREYEERIVIYEKDAELAEKNRPHGDSKFCPMALKGIVCAEKSNAGEMLLAVCREHALPEAEEIGSYRGFKLEIFYDTINSHHCLNLCGAGKHRVDLGPDALGNLVRIENEIAKLPEKLQAVRTGRAETLVQLETAKEEVKKPFAFEEELKEKTERLNALNIELNLDQKDGVVADEEPEAEKESGVVRRKRADWER